MNRQNFLDILESSLLTFDEVTEKEMLELTPLNPECIKIGIDLCNYLKTKEINNENSE